MPIIKYQNYQINLDLGFNFKKNFHFNLFLLTAQLNLDKRGWIFNFHGNN